MININSYAVTERTVYDGVHQGVHKLLEDIQNFKNPEMVIGTITQSVMESLLAVYDFGVQPVRFTPDVLLKIMTAAEEKVTDSSHTSSVSDVPAQ